MILQGVSRHQQQILICTHCARPTFFDHDAGLQVPGSAFGGSVDSLPDSVESLYNEARDCMKVAAYTSAVLACRKLLMNIAVEKGAPEGKKFIEYVEFLAKKGYVPPGGEAWVDHIRQQGNEATHEIKTKSVDDAQDLISFLEMLLKFIYEFPSRVPAPNGSSAAGGA